jgi:hypothetical protein
VGRETDNRREMMKLAGCLIIVTIGAAIGALCWPYSINSWLNYFGKPSMIVWWQGALLGFVPVLGQASIPIAVITWILMMFLR